MKNRFIIIITLFLIIIFSCINRKVIADPGRHIGQLYISKQKPQPGDQLTLIYNDTTRNNSQHQQIKGFYHYSVGTMSFPEDIEFYDSLGISKASIKIPDSATSVAFHISRDNKIDNNNRRGLIIPLYDRNGNIKPGSMASMGFFYTSYGRMYEISSDSASYWIERDLKNNPQLQEEWDIVFGRIISTRDKEKSYPYLKNRIKQRIGKPDPSEKDYKTAYKLLEFIGENSSADSLRQVAIEKYPKGSTRRYDYLKKVQKAKNSAEKKEIFEDFKRVYGLNDNSFEKDYMIESIQIAFAKEGNWDEFHLFSKLWTDRDLQAYFFNDMALNMVENDKYLHEAKKISRTSLQLLDKVDKPEYLSKNQFKEIQEKTRRDYQTTYANILRKLGEFDEAVKYQALALGEGHQSHLNERFIQLLIETGQEEEILKKAPEFIRNNAATTTIKDAYRKAYLKINKTEKGFRKELAEFEEVGKATALREIKNSMLDEVAPEFELEDLNGNSVSLTSLKGKIIVLDFFATWCAPCIKSFPSMKKAVNKYQNNPDVIFLFVNTMENTSTRKKDIISLISKNNFPFRVLIDPALDQFDNHRTITDYKVYDLPTKILIGPDGKVRFKLVGYNGDDGKIEQELDMMIGLLNKKENNLIGSKN